MFALPFAYLSALTAMFDVSRRVDWPRLVLITIAMVAARTFADARGGEIILYEDAYGNIAIAISGGSAADTFFSAQPGVEIRIRLAD